MDGSSAAGRIAWKIQKKGTSVTLRRVSKGTNGPNPFVNPAESGDLLVDGNTPAGATTLSLRSDQCRGRLVVGDRLLLPTEDVLVAAEVTSRLDRPNGFTAVQLARPLTAAVPDGTWIHVGWSADLPTFGVISSFRRSLIDGERIKARDLQVILPAFGVPEPDTSWKLLVGSDRTYTIVNALPSIDGGEIVAWNVQAR